MYPEMIFDWLLGTWSFIRIVSNQAEMTGQASFATIDSETALYNERADVRLLTGKALQGKQSYHYCKTPSGFDVFFPENAKLFQSLTFCRDPSGDLRAHARHDCGADVYQSTYTIGVNGSFEVQHLVRGPRKHHLIETSYFRSSND